MDSARHEIIVTPENVPAYIVIHDASVALSDNAIPHWHEEPSQRQR